MATKFADVLKGAKDLVSKAYAADSNKVELKTATGGVAYTAEAAIGAKTSVSLKGEFKVGDFKVDKLAISSKDDLAFDFSTDLQAVKGAKLYGKALDSSRAAGAEGIKFNVGVEYKAGNAFSTVDVDVTKFDVLPVEATVVFAYEGFLVGGQVKSGLRNPTKVSDANALLGYKAKGTAFTVQTDSYFAGVTAGVTQDVNKDLTVGAVAKFKRADKGAFALEAGLAQKWSADQTVSAKVNQKGVVGLSFAHTLSAVSKLTVSASVDAANIGGDSHKVGLLLNLTA